MAFVVNKEAWYSAQETADLRGVSLKTLEAERGAGGGIPFSRIGRRIFYHGADIGTFLEGRRQRSTADVPKIQGPAPRPKKKAGDEVSP